MSVHTFHRGGSLASQSAELAFAVPQVVAHRMARMAMAGLSPSKRDQAEFKLMSEEKFAAFQESWIAMASQVVQVQQQAALQMLQAFWSPMAWRAPSYRTMERQWSRASMSVLGKGLEPISRRAVANAKRLGEL
ncbi:hypothetical protein GN316_10750 [Xylophilus sp. Kf1]|nr:hypothetical protein [Xylophilus sp. Kf1]